MATNFKLWVDTASTIGAGQNVLDAATFASDTFRSSGWAAGNTVSSLKMNSILRQNSLVVVALMEAFCPTSTVSLTSSLANVKSALLAGIASKADLMSLTNTVVDNTSTLATHDIKIDEVETAVNQILSGSETVMNSSNLGGHPSTYYQKKITIGTANPTGGSNGDIYIKYTV